MGLVDSVEPGKAIAVRLITGRQQGGAIGRAQAVAVIDDRLALMAREDGDLQPTHGVLDGSAALQNGKLLLAFWQVTEDIGGRGDGFVAGEKAAGYFGVGVVIAPVADEEGVGGIGEEIELGIVHAEARGGHGAEKKAGSAPRAAREAEAERSGKGRKTFQGNLTWRVGGRT
jgi:hypothetical protein